MMGFRSYRAISVRLVRKRATRYIPVAFLCILALLPLATWFKGSALLWGGDGFFPLNLAEISRYFTIPSIGESTPNVLKLPLDLPWGLILLGLRNLGVPWNSDLAQKILDVILMGLSGLGAYGLTRNLFPSLSRWVATIAGAFYMYNRVTLLLVWTPQSALVFHYSLLPVLILVILRLSRRPTFVSGTYVGVVWTLLMSVAYTTLPLVPTDAVLVAVWLAFAVLRGGFKLRNAAAMLSGVGLSWTILNLYWLVPVLRYARLQLQQGTLGVAGQSVSAFEFNSAGLSKLFRLGGFWGLHVGAFGVPYFSWGSYYQGFVLLLAYVPTCLAMVAMISALKGTDRGDYVGPRRALAILTFLLVGFALLATGSNSPFGGLKLAFFVKSGLVAEYRSTYARFVEYIPLFLAPLVAVGSAEVERFIFRGLQDLIKTKRVLRLVWRVMVSGICFVIIPFPLVSGAAFGKIGQASTGRVVVPSGLESIAAHLSSRPAAGQTLVLPLGPSTVVHLNWPMGGYQGIQPLLLLSGTTLVEQSLPSHFSQDLFTALKRRPTLLCQLLQRSDIHYVVQEVNEVKYLDIPHSKWIWSSDLRVIGRTVIGAPCLHLVDKRSSASLWINDGWVGLYGMVYDRGVRAFNLAKMAPVKLQNAAVMTVQPIKWTDWRGGNLVLPIAYDPNWRLDGTPPTNLDGQLSWTLSEKQISGGVIVVNSTQQIYDYLLALSSVFVVGTLMLSLIRYVKKRKK